MGRARGPGAFPLLHLQGIESVVIEARSRQYCEERVRAGLLEQGTVDLLTETGLGERLKRIGLVHYGLNLRYHRETHRIDFGELAGGRGRGDLSSATGLAGLVQCARERRRPNLVRSGRRVIFMNLMPSPRKTRRFVSGRTIKST